MVWSGKIISQRFTAVFSKENSTGILNARHGVKRIFGNDFQMFRSNFVGCVNRGFHIRCNQKVSVIIQGFTNDIGTAQCLQKAFDFFFYLFGKILACGNEDGRCQFVMFRL